MRSPWARFVDFWIMCEMGTHDATYRAYIRDDKWYDHITHVTSASARLKLGVVPGDYAWKRAMIEVQTRFASMGAYNVPLHLIRIRLNQWFVYDKVLTEEIRINSQLPRTARAALKGLDLIPAGQDENPLF